MGTKEKNSKTAKFL